MAINITTEATVRTKIQSLVNYPNRASLVSDDIIEIINEVYNDAFTLGMHMEEQIRTKTDMKIFMPDNETIEKEAKYRQMEGGDYESWRGACYWMRTIIVKLIEK